MAQLHVGLRVEGGPLLGGIRLAAAYLDLEAGRLCLASTGGCRAAVAARDATGLLQAPSLSPLRLTLLLHAHPPPPSPPPPPFADYVLLTAS